MVTKTMMITDYEEKGMHLIIYRNEINSGMFEIDHAEILNVTGGKITLTKDDAIALQKIFRNEEAYL